MTIYAAPGLTTTLPANIVTTGNTDAYGRTQIMGTTSIQAPSLRQLVSVADAPWGAKGDAISVTDGSISSSSNTTTLTCATSKPFTSTAVDSGKTIMIAGAGAAGVMLTTTIVSVTSSSVAVINTAASTTVSGAIVKFGTDDSAAFQSVENAVSARSGGVITAIPGAQYIVGQITPKNNVSHDLRGATIHFKFGNGGIWGGPSAPALSNWSLRGGVFPGTLMETDLSNHAILYTGTSVQSSNIYITEVQASNWTSALLELENCSIAHATYCRFTGTICTAAQRNAINFVMRSGSGLLSQHLYAIGNYIENCATEAISMVTTGSPSTTEVRGTIIGNNCSSGPTGNGAVIDVELSTTAATEYSKFVLANNICTSNFTSNSTYAMSISGSAGAGQLDPFFGRKSVVQGNVLDATAGSRVLLVQMSEVEVTGNVITGQAQAVFIGSFSSTVTGTTTNNSTSITSVTGTQSIYMNYGQLQGTGIVNGAYLASGATTSTWTMNTAATASGTVTITIQIPLRHVDISHNTVHCTTTSPVNYVVEYQQVIHGTYSYNRVYSDGGAANTNHHVLFQYCGWLDIHHAVSEWSGGHAFVIEWCNDVAMEHCRAYNPSDGGSGFHGYFWANVTGATNKMESCTAVDDRAVHQMSYGANVAATTNGTVALINCEFHGYTTVVAATGTYRFSRGNISDTHTGGDVFYFTATNSSWPLPPGVNTVRVSAWGGGGGGGGGGAAGGGSPVSGQVGGSGGTAGMFTQAIFSTAGSTAAVITVGAGGAFGAGGAAGSGSAGNAGTAGSIGVASSVTIGSNVLRAEGGGAGIAGGANSTTTVSARSWGGTSAGATGSLVAGSAGGASATAGTAGGQSVGWVAGGGSGGGPASATNGGTGGNAGANSVVESSSITTIGGSGTTSGTNGGSAAANSGGGGGGGGGGSYNSGTGPGAGGNGGTGGSGGVIIEVLN